MLRHILNGTIRGQWPTIQQVCRESTESAKWDLLVGVQLERLPVVSKSLNKIERDYQELLRQLEFENSYKSDFELQSEKDEKMTELIKSGKVEMDVDAVSTQTTQDLKDIWKEELNKFQLAPRVTEADKNNDKTSTNRKLEESLTLVVEQQVGDEKIALLPESRLQEGETLRQAAERMIKATCGDSAQAQIYGNAPCGFYKYKYPRAMRKDVVGAKVFFYRAVLKAGQVDKKLGKFEWLDKEELMAKVDKYVDYKKCLKQFIV